ncbi:hypothetical protein [Pseudocitrobacter cyperus]|uniref:Type 1 fimbrial protein n=1 Tax=Pseudocitrobacter cyperus TaxID=3112843 RepID=A0ABV0HE46_9ENTR
MKRTLQFGLMAALIACPILAGAASGGVIHFRGMIVEDACNIKPDNGVVHVSCYREGKQHRETHLLNQNTQFNIMQDIATTQLYPVADHPELQVLQITYR